MNKQINNKTVKTISHSVNLTYKLYEASPTVLSMSWQMRYKRVTVDNIMIIFNVKSS